MPSFSFYTVPVDGSGRLFGRYACGEIIPSVFPISRPLGRWLGRGGRNILSRNWPLENAGDLTLWADACIPLALQALNFAVGRFQLLLQRDHNGIISLRLFHLQTVGSLKAFNLVIGRFQLHPQLEHFTLIDPRPAVIRVEFL